MTWMCSCQAGATEELHAVCTGGRQRPAAPAVARAAAGGGLSGAVHDRCAMLLHAGSTDWLHVMMAYEVRVSGIPCVDAASAAGPFTPKSPFCEGNS